MTKRFFLFLSFLAFLPASALAADFTAGIDNTHIVAGRSVRLLLTLSGTAPTALPDIDVLQKSFTIVSEADMPNPAGVKGAPGSPISWLLTLTPKDAGEVVVPAVTIDTAAGRLSTKALKLEVDRYIPQISPQPNVNREVLRAPPADTKRQAASITASADTVTPYQNQPIYYTVRLVLRANISEASLSDISLDSAIIEKANKPDIYDSSENGFPVKVVELHYVITPLQPGKLVIPSLIFEGVVQTPDRPVPIDPFTGNAVSNSLQQIMNFFSSLAGDGPLRVASNTTVLDVRPPAAALDPWLPLRSLTITEDAASSQDVRVGEPLTRKITLLANGAPGSQLPDLESQQDHTDFKVYADKPELGETIDKKAGAVLGWRKETYSLIPQKSGQLVLPAITVSWWDIVNNRLATAQLPERIVTVLPGAAGANVVEPRPAQGVYGLPPIWRSLALLVSAQAGIFFLYGIIGVLTATLLYALWKMAARRAKPVGKWALKHVHTAPELKDFLQTYAHQRWGLSRNVSVERIFASLPDSQAARERGDIEVVIKGLTSALYAGKSIDLEDLKRRCWNILVSMNKDVKSSRSPGEKLPYLNPR